MRGLVQIFAVGGGGFTHSQEGDGRDALLEDRLLALVGPVAKLKIGYIGHANNCLLYTSPSPRDGLLSRMPSSA